MKLAELLHNPTAGEEEHTEKQLVKAIKAAGFKCRYLSTKTDDWKHTSPDTDFFIVAGGDGTIRKVAKSIYNQETANLPIALIPLGTANNVAQTMGIAGDTETIIDSWRNKDLKKVDAGNITGLPKANFFLEGFGYGVFPRLMKAMLPHDAVLSTTEEKIQTALEELYSIVLSIQAVDYQVIVDDKDYSGKYLMVEIMNIQSIGPNLHLAPDADPGDGLLDIVLVPDNQRGSLAAYVRHLIAGTPDTVFPLHTITGKQVQISCEEQMLHADDKLMELEEPAAPITLSLSKGLLRFLVTSPVQA